LSTVGKSLSVGTVTPVNSEIAMPAPAQRATKRQRRDGSSCPSGKQQQQERRGNEDEGHPGCVRVRRDGADQRSRVVTALQPVLDHEAGENAGTGRERDAQKHPTDRVARLARRDERPDGRERHGDGRREHGRDPERERTADERHEQATELQPDGERRQAPREPARAGCADRRAAVGLDAHRAHSPL